MKQSKQTTKNTITEVGRYQSKWFEVIVMQYSDDNENDSFVEIIKSYGDAGSMETSRFYKQDLTKLIELLQRSLKGD